MNKAIIALVGMDRLNEEVNLLRKELQQDKQKHEEKYGIGANRIDVVTSESIGYENLTGCNAKILFITTK